MVQSPMLYLSEIGTAIKTEDTFHCSQHNYNSYCEKEFIKLKWGMMKITTTNKKNLLQHPVILLQDIILIHETTNVSQKQDTTKITTSS